MKTFSLSTALFLFFFACKPTESKVEVKEEPLPDVALSDSLHGRVDTAILKDIEVVKESEGQKKVVPPPRITDHVCSPNFTALANPKANHHVFYVTAFDHEEFACWEAVEEHATGICKDQNCKIIYVDKADLSIDASKPDYFDAAVLKEHGVGRFVHKGKFWDLDGAGKAWRKPGNGWSYYNTNNQFGG